MTEPKSRREAARGRQIAVHPLAKVARKRIARRNLPLIVIDPGHGGKDSGAVGVTGLLEKNITLATALELQHELQATGQFRVEMTRNRDAFVSLRDRTALARSQNTALFLSIHADASVDHHARGASVYIRPNTLTPARITELPANSANSGAIGQTLAARPAQSSPGSSLLQYTMVDQLQDDIAMVRDPARQAHLYVLGTTGIPSVLVEMGFLSNRTEERLLKKKDYRRVISQAIRDAISDYFNDLSHAGAARI